MEIFLQRIRDLKIILRKPSGQDNEKRTLSNAAADAEKKAALKEILRLQRNLKALLATDAETFEIAEEAF
jgi:hypothetical protein